jgi:type I restriction enzyme M protein
MPEPFLITHSASGTALKAASRQWRFSFAELRNRLAHGQFYGLAQSLGDIVDVLAFLCILRVEEHEEAERRAVEEFNGTHSAPEFPEKARWNLLESIPPDQFASHVQEGLFPSFREIPATSPLRLLPRLFDPARFRPAAYQAALEMLSSPLLPFDRYLELERGEKSMSLEDKAAQLFSGWKGVGEFITPGRVADLMIDLAAPKPGERIYNPCTGFGTLLVRTAKRIVLPGLRERSPTEAQRVRTSTFFGMELNPSICLVALARLMLAGITRPRLELGDVLERPTPDAGHNGGFDVILCNPPFGSAATPEQMARFAMRSRSMETLMMQHILAHLRPGGRAVVLMPEAFLYRQGAEEALRKRLLNEFRVEAVVAVPEGNIHGLGEIRTSLLVIHRQESAGEVVFVPAKATQEVLWGYKEGHRKNEVLPCLLKELGRSVETAPAEKQATGRSSALLFINKESVENLASRRWELVAKSKGVDQLQVLLDTVQRTDAQTEIRTLKGALCTVWSGWSYKRTDMIDAFSQAGRTPGADPRENSLVVPPTDRQRAVVAQLEDTEDVRLVRVRDLVKVGAAQDLKLVATPTMARMTAEGIKRASGHCFLHAGDILLTVTGTIGKVAVVGDGGPRMVAASGVTIIRAREKVLASYLPTLTDDRAVSKLAQATQLRRDRESIDGERRRTSTGASLPRRRSAGFDQPCDSRAKPGGHD